MTRLAVLADIHGNAPALAAVQADLARQAPVDHVIVAGDVVNWGPHSAEVMAEVTRQGWAVIRGNNEDYLLDYETPRMPPAWREYALLPWLKRQLAGRWQAVIAAWPDTLSLRFPDAPPIRVVHGSARRNTEPLYPDLTDAQAAERLAGVDETIVIAAHTHLPMDRPAGRWRVLNPGSVGVPLDGAPGGVYQARYLVLEAVAGAWRAEFRAAPFDLRPVLETFAQQDFAAQYGVTAELVIQEFAQARLRIVPFLAWRAAQRPDAPLTPDLLAEFATINPWTYTPAAYHVNC